MEDETVHSLPEEVTNEAPINEEISKETKPSKEELETRNFAALREKALRAERERDEALRLVREMETKRQQSIIEDDEDITIGPDDLAEGKHLSKVQKKIKNLENQLKKYQQESSESTIETKIRYNYPDFDSVVSRENLESLRNNYPELMQTINTSNDMYNKAASAYTLIKKLGIDQGSYEMDKQRVRENANKPKPLASIPTQQGQGALSHANAFAGGLTKELQSQLLKEMMDARKGF